MPTPMGSWYDIDLGIKQDEDDAANAEVVITGGCVPWAGTVKEIWVGLNVVLTTGTLAVVKCASTDISLLAAATANLASTTTFPAATLFKGVKMALTTETTALHVNAGDMIRATWTITSFTAQTIDQTFTCLVRIEPEVW